MAYITRSYFYCYYKNYFCTDICCFFLLLNVFILVLPFFLSYATEGFWDLVRDYHEQPMISFKGDLALECVDKTNVYFYTNIQNLNYLNQHAIKPSVKVTLTFSLLSLVQQARPE